MAKLDIILAPDPRLATVCEPVKEVDDALGKLLDDMLDTMYAAPGIGLAAPQIGVLRRFFVVDVGEENARDPQVFINPEIVTKEGETTFNEGCLSFPGIYACWHENPGGDGKGEWKDHRVADHVDNESPQFGDVNGDGRPDLVFSLGGRFTYATFDPEDPTAPWQLHWISGIYEVNKIHTFNGSSFFNIQTRNNSFS